MSMTLKEKKDARKKELEAKRKKLEEEKEKLEEKFPCQFCGKEYDTDRGRKIHELQCPDNPDKKEKKPPKEKAPKIDSSKIEEQLIKQNELTKKELELIREENISLKKETKKSLEEMEKVLEEFYEAFETDSDKALKYKSILNEIEEMIRGIIIDDSEIVEIYKRIEEKAHSRKIFTLSEDSILTTLKARVKIMKNNKELPYPQPRSAIQKNCKYYIDDTVIQNNNTEAFIRELYTNRRSVVRGVIDFVNRFPEECILGDESTNTVDTKTLLAVKEYFETNIFELKKESEDIK